MIFQRIVERTLPDGTVAKVYPFHISLEGMQSILLCRDDEDYDHLQKSFYLGTWCSNALVIIDIAMSTHGHCAVLASTWDEASRTGEYVKKRHSQFLAYKYGDRNVLARTRISVQYLDTDRYVRNALAYIPRNAADTGCRIEDYRWSSYRGMFVEGKAVSPTRSVSALSRREKETLMRTHMDLRQVPWILDAEDRIEPVSVCDYTYLENAFLNDQAFFLRMIGSVNPSEMRQKLVLNAREWQTDSAFLLSVSNVSDSWYHKGIRELTVDQKKHMLPYLYRSYRTSATQLARCIRLSPEEVRRTLHENGIKTK